MSTRIALTCPLLRIRSEILPAAMLLVIAACAGPTEEADIEQAVSQPAPPAETIQSAKGRPQSAIVRQQRAHVGAYADSQLEESAAQRHWPATPANRERYPRFDDNPVHSAATDPVSTFSIDVDTASYSRLRRFLSLGQAPHADAVRTEELINYFDYGYTPPAHAQQPFAVHLEMGPSPWNTEKQLLKIGLKGFERAHGDLPPANLVFLVDVSESMRGPDRIDLLKRSLGLLVRKLRPEDHISIAVYAGAAGVVLEPTTGDQQAKVLAALDKLEAGGSTNGGAGIQLAYNLARQAFADEGINRVILATDGDFNVGTVDQRALQQLVERERGSGIGLTVLGFGTGNYNDALMQTLAQKGDGQAAYVDSLNEGRKVLVEQLAGTLETIARDVKIQVEFNPARVAEYRLIGYETRHLEREDFNNDQVDAGDIGAGHTVTALYEITPVEASARLIDPLRYQSTPEINEQTSDEVAFVRLRYKLPGQDTSRLIERAVRTADAIANLEQTSADFRFAAAVAGLGQLLRGGGYTDGLEYTDVVQLAREARGDDPFGYRGEFIGLVITAAALAGQPTG